MKNYKKNKKILEESFNYSQEMEHDACGVGLIASTNGNERGAKLRDIVEKTMTPSQQEKAQDLARECVRKKYKGC